MAPCDLGADIVAVPALQRIEKDVAAVHALMVDLALLVENQGEVLDRIEGNVEGAREYVQRANEELQEANARKARGRRLKTLLAALEKKDPMQQKELERLEELVKSREDKESTRNKEIKRLRAEIDEFGKDLGEELFPCCPDLYQTPCAIARHNTILLGSFALQGSQR